ncbi:hypothetical protein D3C79_860040 [compost metagenome]
MQAITSLQQENPAGVVDTQQPLVQLLEAIALQGDHLHTLASGGRRVRRKHPHLTGRVGLGCQTVQRDLERQRISHWIEHHRNNAWPGWPLLDPLGQQPTLCR